MTAIPQLVAIFNGFGGGASALVAIYEILYQKESVLSIFVLAAIAFSTVLGSLTLTGSFIAFGKLQEIIPTRPILFPLRNYLNSLLLLLIIFVLRSAVGSRRLSDMRHYFLSGKLITKWETTRCIFGCGDRALAMTG